MGEFSGDDILLVINMAAAVVAALWGVWQKVKAKRYDAALVLANDSLATVVAAIESYGRKRGREAQADEIKAIVRRLADRTGVEAAHLGDFVQEVVDDLEYLGSFDQADGWLETRVQNALAESQGERAARRLRKQMVD